MQQIQTNVLSTSPTVVTQDALLQESAFLTYKLRVAENRIVAQEQKIRELEALASTDPLTGLMNRRSFEKAFAQELSRVRRHKTPGCVLMLFDLDKFKQINDTYGHQAGDACLKAVADYLKARLRSVDSAARFGGDEFAILLSNTTPTKAAEEIKSALKRLEINWHGETVSFGVSVGIHHVTSEGTYEKAYMAADRDLYLHKENKDSFYI